MIGAISHRNMSNPLLLPEIVASVIENVHQVPDLLNCACVKRMWNVAALKKLYRGSLHDMQFCTPDIGSLNCLFVASRERFARYMSFMKHLLLSTDTMAVEQFAPLEQFAGTASYAMRDVARCAIANMRSSFAVAGKWSYQRRRPPR
jgi:hypothetical protein